MPHSVRAAAHLYDVVRSIDLIVEYLGDTDPEGYRSSRQLKDAVERRFGIVAEALARLEASDPLLHAGISNTHAIRGFRNVVIHEYDRVDVGVVFDVVRKHLPTLRAEAAAFLREIDEAAAGDAAG